jgi:hypothetical protein
MDGLTLTSSLQLPRCATWANTDLCVCKRTQDMRGMGSWSITKWQSYLLDSKQQLEKMGCHCIPLSQPL